LVIAENVAKEYGISTRWWVSWESVFCQLAF
jgi:hypothetical protein